MRKLAYFAAVALLCTGIAVAQSTPSSDQSSSPSSAQQPSSTDQQQPSADQSQTSPSSTGAASTSDQTGQAGAAADQTGNAKAGEKLPQTASPLPFLTLLGMGMVGAGGIGRVRNFFRK